jgi:hypothetical protein
VGLAERRLAGPISSTGGGRFGSLSTKGLVLSPEVFEVVVRGRLSPALLASFSGFDATHCTDGHTHLLGAVPDQAKIHGLFNTLLGLNIELVSVNPVANEESH